MNVMHLLMHFKRRGYPLELILEAAIKARQLDRTTLLDTGGPKDETDANKVFLITTYHPNDQTARNIARQNWEILGQSPTTENLYSKKLTIGYRRQKKPERPAG